MKLDSQKKLFQNQFNQMAKYYDFLEPVPLFLHKLILKKCSSKKDDFLEIGCGTGRLLNLVSPRYKKTVAVDFSKEMINIAKKRINKNITYFNISASEIQFEDEQFDFVVCNALFHHLSNDKKELIKVLKKIKKILRPGGRIFISDFVAFKLFRNLSDWVHYVCVTYNSVRKGKFNFYSELKKEPEIYRTHLKSERGMFFTRKEFMKIFGDVFENSKINFIGKRRKIISMYYLIWDKK